MLVIKLIRAMLSLIASAITLYALVGWIGQFPAARRYPWIFDIWTSLRPLGRAVAIQLPTVHNRMDFSMFWVIAAVLIAYFGASRLLTEIENAIIGFDKRRQRKAEGQAKPQAPAQAQAAAQSKPAAAVIRVPDLFASTMPLLRPGGRFYQSELLVVIDLVDSTTIVTRFGDQLLARMKARLERNVLPVCQRHLASYIKGTGDGYLVSFTSIAHGTAALREIFAQLDAMNERLPDGAELALRASVNFGDVIVERDGDRTGGAVHKTFRLQSVGAKDLIEAEGGIKRSAFPIKNYVIASEESLSGLQQADGTKWQLLGLCELKGFPGLHRVYELECLPEDRSQVVQIVPVDVSRPVQSHQ